MPRSPMNAELNPSQRAAVQTLRGPLLVLAGAGTGKTRVVTYRVAELIRTGTSPDRILAVTFTNKAAKEMQQRIGERLGKRLKARPLICTFHAYCVQVLRRHIAKLGYPERYAIYDRGDQESVARTVLRDIRCPTEVLRPGDLLFLISNWKNQGVHPQHAATLARTDKEHLAAAAFRRYQVALKQAGAVDFDDLLLCTDTLYSRFPTARDEEAGRFDHLLVDEYQDTNGTQYRIVKSLAAGHRNLCVVGDDDQSIYGWRGAEVEHILRFHHDWPDAKVVRLQDNYRSTGAILTLANRLIQFNAKRHDKILQPARPDGPPPRIHQHKNETAEAQFVVADIARRLRQPGMEPRDFAILFRTNEQPRSFEAELRRANLPYVLLGSKSFFDRKEIRDLLAYLKVLDAPQDEVSLRRVINTPPRGIGGKSFDALLAAAVSAGKPLWQIVTDASRVNQAAPAARQATERFVKMIQTYRARARQPGTSLHQLLRELITQIDYQSYLERRYDNPNERQARWASVEELVNAVAEYQQRSQQPTLAEFLTETALGDRDFGDRKEQTLKRNGIALMTIHSAKGLEFPEVYLVGLEEGILPHRRSVEGEGEAIDEERRLCYVGVTRAQERLTLSMALTRMKWGKPRPTHASRFLFEMIGKADPPPLRKQVPHGQRALPPSQPHAPAKPPSSSRTSPGKSR